MPAGPTVSNSSCLISLEHIGRLELLTQLYGTVAVPEAVVQEWRTQSTPSWLQRCVVQDLSQIEAFRDQIGQGESEAIALALEVSAAQIILDDKKARRAARQLDLHVSGTLAIVLDAKEQGLIPAVHPILDDLRQTGFRISESLFQQALRLANE